MPPHNVKVPGPRGWRGWRWGLTDLFGMACTKEGAQQDAQACEAVSNGLRFVSPSQGVHSPVRRLFRIVLRFAPTSTCGAFEPLLVGRRNLGVPYGYDGLGLPPGVCGQLVLPRMPLKG